MTPLFAATQLSQTQSDTGSIGTGLLRATQQQSLAFTPTQGQGREGESERRDKGVMKRVC